MEKGESRTKNPSLSECSQTDWVPFDLAREILIRLPAASLMRFRCVSKKWASVTSDQDFILSFTTKSRSCLLLNFQKNDNQLFFRLSQHKNLEMYLTNVETYPLTLLKEDSYASNSHLQSVHGLISFNYLCHVMIWNPSMRQHVTFRKPHEKPFYIRTYLGYDPIGCTYKVLSMALFSTKATHVLTLGDQESWRPIKHNIPRRTFPSKWICINGVLYFFVSNDGRAEILCFDVRTEKFRLIQCVHDDLETNIYLVNYKERLARVISKSSCYELWVLEEAENDKWSRQDFHLPYSPHDYGNYGLTGVTDDDEFIYVSVSWQDKNIHVSYYDPKRKSNRIIKIERSGDEDFWLHDEWSEYNWGLTGCIPNHIENLICVKNFTCIPSV